MDVMKLLCHCGSSRPWRHHKTWWVLQDSNLFRSRTNSFTDCFTLSNSDAYPKFFSIYHLRILTPFPMFLDLYVSVCAWQLGQTNSRLVKELSWALPFLWWSSRGIGLPSHSVRRQTSHWWGLTPSLNSRFRRCDAENLGASPAKICSRVFDRPDFMPVSTTSYLPFVPRDWTFLSAHLFLFLELETGFEPAWGLLPTAYKAVAVSRLATPA